MAKKFFLTQTCLLSCYNAQIKLRELLVNCRVAWLKPYIRRIFVTRYSVTQTQCPIHCTHNQKRAKMWAWHPFQLQIFMPPIMVWRFTIETANRCHTNFLARFFAARNCTHASKCDVALGQYCICIWTHAHTVIRATIMALTFNGIVFFL